MDTTSKALVGVIAALLATLVGVVVAFSSTLRRRRDDLQACQDTVLVLENRWASCKEELRSARMLE